MSVHVEWIAHACFRIWRDDGPVIVMDPFTPKNLHLPEDETTTVSGDTVIVSSLTDKAHGNPSLVPGQPRVINALEVAEQGIETEIDGSPLITVAAAESPHHDSGKPKDNALYAVQVGGLWILHMGDLGYGLSEEQLAPFVNRCDLLLAIVGQANTLSLEDVDAMIDRLQPKWIVPMHYRLWWPTKMRPVDEFLERRPKDPLYFARQSTVQFPLEARSPGSEEPVVPRIVVLEPSARPDAMSATKRTFTPATAPLPVDFVEDEVALSRAAVIAFTEGPACHADGSVYFSDIVNNRIMKRAADGTLSVFRSDSGRANGNMFDQQGRLVTCESAGMGPGGRRRVTRTDLETGEVTVLTDRYNGKRYNAPNDLAIDNQGRIYFTDPCYSDRSNMEMEEEGVYRIDPDGNVTRVLSQPAFQQPNGIALSPDDKTLYIVDHNIRPGGNRRIWAFDLEDDLTPVNQRLVYDFGVGRAGDGLRVDSLGNLWTAAGVALPKRAGESAVNPPGIYVLTPEGELLGIIPIPEDQVTNMTFGGPYKKTLYVTAGKTLFQIQIKVSGWSVFP